MKTLLATTGSFLLTAAVVGNAFYQKKQFYSSMVYLTKSSPSMGMLYLQALVVVILFGKLMRYIFFGQLRALEMEHLIEKSWYAVTETCLAFTVFRDDFSPRFVALFTLLLFLKCFHWLVEDRVDYMERSPLISLVFHVRVVSLLMLLALLDFLFVRHAYLSTVSKGASTQLVFGFEYAILLTVTAQVLVKYILHTLDMQSDSTWDNKAVYLLYSELALGCVKVMLYMMFLAIMIKIHTFPLFIVRPMYLTMRTFRKALNDVVLSRRAIHNMNTLYPDATAEELAAGDNVCIICREEMTQGCKKLPCNHIFHRSCLRSWFQRQQTCPTCRLDVLRPADRAAAAGGAQAAQPQPPAPAPGLMGGMFGLPGMMPPAPPMWPMFPPPPQQQPAAAASPPSSGSFTSVPASSTASSTVFSPLAMPPMPFMPPPFMPPPPFMFSPSPFSVPFPSMPANLSTLSDEELRAMEGAERSNVEARVNCLRNIQTLLDAAVAQMQQYLAVSASFSPPPAPYASSTNGSTSASATADGSANGSGNGSTSVSASANGAASVSGPATVAQVSSDQPTAAKTTGSVSEACSAPSTEAGGVDTSSADNNEVRQRRLQRLAEAQRPT